MPPSLYLRRGPGGAAQARRPAKPTAWVCALRVASEPPPAPATRALCPSGCIADAPPSAAAGTTNILSRSKGALSYKC